MQRSRSTLSHMQQHHDMHEDSNLTEQQLESLWNQPCSQDLLLFISENIAKWKEMAPYLGLTDMDVADITGCDPSTRAQSQAMLKKWRQRFGNTATYRKLADIFVRCGRQDLADCVSELVPKTPYKLSCNNNNTSG